MGSAARKGRGIVIANAGFRHCESRSFIGAKQSPCRLEPIAAVRLIRASAMRKPTFTPWHWLIPLQGNAVKLSCARPASRSSLRGTKQSPCRLSANSSRKIALLSTSQPFLFNDETHLKLNGIALQGVWGLTSIKQRPLLTSLFNK